MTVLHLDSGRELRGGQHQVLLLCRALAERGIRQLLLARAGSPLLDAARRQGISTQELGWRSLWRAAGQYGRVHAHDARTHTMGAIVCPERLIVSRRVAFPIATGPASRWKYQQALGYLAVSQAVAHCLRQAGVPEARVRVVYDAVPLPAATASGEEIVSLATNDLAKGSDLVRRTAELAGVPVHFSSDLHADLPRAKLFIYLTRQEGLGSAALLAMAYGVPVLASAVGGLPEIVRPFATGMLTPNEPAEAARLLRWLLSDASRLREMGRAGRSLVAGRFTADQMGEATLRAYEAWT